MPAVPPTTPRFGLPRYDPADPADFPSQFNAGVDLADSALLDVTADTYEAVGQPWAVVASVSGGLWNTAAPLAAGTYDFFGTTSISRMGVSATPNFALRMLEVGAVEPLAAVADYRLVVSLLHNHIHAASPGIQSSLTMYEMPTSGDMSSLTAVVGSTVNFSHIGAAAGYLTGSSIFDLSSAASGVYVLRYVLSVAGATGSFASLQVRLERRAYA